jgi:hypothetical protein
VVHRRLSRSFVSTFDLCTHSFPLVVVLQSGLFISIDQQLKVSGVPRRRARTSSVFLRWGSQRLCILSHLRSPHFRIPSLRPRRRSAHYPVFPPPPFRIFHSAHDFIHRAYSILRLEIRRPESPQVRIAKPPTHSSRARARLHLPIHLTRAPRRHPLADAPLHPLDTGVP